MFHWCIEQTGEAYEPCEIATLMAALDLACDRWDLAEPLTDARRNQLAATILVSAQFGFSDCGTLAGIALNKCRITNAANGTCVSLLDLHRRIDELDA